MTFQIIEKRVSSIEIICKFFQSIFLSISMFSRAYGFTLVVWKSIVYITSQKGFFPNTVYLKSVKQFVFNILIRIRKIKNKIYIFKIEFII